MEMISVGQAAKRWNVTLRRVQDLCKRGEIPGAARLGRAWMIPADAQYPGRRTENAVPKCVKLPKHTPFLYLTNLWHTPGEADACAAALSDNPDARRLFEAQLALARGDVQSAYTTAKIFFDRVDDTTASVLGALLLSECAIWQGNPLQWQDAKLRIDEAECTNDRERDLIALAKIVMTIQIHDLGNLPEWFMRGEFETAHPDTYPALWSFYAKYMYIAAYESAVERLTLEDAPGLGLMRVLPYLCGPLIAQAKADRCVVAELYLYIACATSYHHIGDDVRASKYVRMATALALPDRLYGILAQYRTYLDTLLDDCLGTVDPAALAKIKGLNKTWTAGWTGFYNALHNRRFCLTLTVREREIARLAAFGMTNRQIAARLNIAESTVKQTIRIAIYKSGVNDRSELSEVL